MFVMKATAAQAWLTRWLTLLASYMSSSGCCAIISRVVPFSTSYSQSGDKRIGRTSSIFQLQDKVVTSDYEQAR